MRNLFKAIVLALLIPCGLFAQVLPAEQEDVLAEENVEDVSSEHHMIYYDDLLIGTEFYLDGKVVNDLSEMRRYLLANEYSRPYAKASNWVRAFAYLFAGASGMMLVGGFVTENPYNKYLFIGSAASFVVGITGGFVSGHYLEKAIDEYR
ncbi:hypothetical protein [Fibrobacter succinogenes]|uniref:hypothetical protein n=1 Tax=Fibrobacter succinogenes TaxID=833 RepID=UPI0013D3C3EB|nr:hypothetical protein [Fibrobacter succinogenes]